MDNVCNRCLFSIPPKVEMTEEQEYLWRLTWQPSSAPPFGGDSARSSGAGRRSSDDQLVWLACVASVSVGFPRKLQCFGRAKVGARAKKEREGVGEEKRKRQFSRGQNIEICAETLRKHLLRRLGMADFWDLCRLYHWSWETETGSEKF